MCAADNRLFLLSCRDPNTECGVRSAASRTIHACTSQCRHGGISPIRCKHVAQSAPAVQERYTQHQPHHGSVLIRCATCVCAWVALVALVALVSLSAGISLIAGLTLCAWVTRIALISGVALVSLRPLGSCGARSSLRCGQVTRGQSEHCNQQDGWKKVFHDVSSGPDAIEDVAPSTVGGSADCVCTVPRLRSRIACACLRTEEHRCWRAPLLPPAKAA